VATEYNLLKNIGDVEVYTDYKILKVKVPIIFSRHVGFPLRRDRRYEPRITGLCAQGIFQAFSGFANLPLGY
jgi:hypothetical protein